MYKLKLKRAFIAPILIVAAVLIANLISISGVFNANPVNQLSGLGVQAKKGIISGYDTLDPNNGFTSQALGHLAAEDWLHGHIPWWNYYEGIGAPLAGEMQSGALFPLVLLLHFSNGLLFEHIILESVAGIATFYFLKRLKIKNKTAFIFGIVFAISGTFSWLTNAAFNPVAFLPLLLLGIEFSFSKSRKHQKGGWTVLSLALALSIYAGFPETAFIDSTFAFIWAILRLPHIEKKYRIYYLKKLIGGGLVGLMLAAPIIVAFLDYLPYALTGLHDGLFANTTLPSAGLSNLFMPYVYGPIFAYSNLSTTTTLTAFWGSTGGYLTASGLILSSFGLMAKHVSKITKIFLAIWIILCVGKTFDINFILWLVNIVPIMKDIAFYRYCLPSLEFVIIVLSAFGLDAILNNEIERKSIRIGSLAALLIILVLAFHSRVELHTISSARHSYLWAFASIFIALIAVIVIYFASTSKRFKEQAFIIIATIVLFESFLFYIIPQLASPRSVNLDTGPVTFLQKNLGTSRFYTVGPIEPNYGSYFQIASINQNDLPVPKTWSNYISTQLDTNANPILFTGYSRVTPTGPTSVQEFFDHIKSYEATGVKYLVTGRGLITKSIAEKHDLSISYEDKLVDIYKLPTTSSYFSVLKGECSITNSSFSTLVSQCNGPSTIVRRELFLPGWSAKTTNGDAVKIKPHQTMYQSVSLPKGKSTVTFSYLPPHIKEAVIAFVAGVLWLFVINLENIKTYYKKLDWPRHTIKKS